MLSPQDKCQTMTSLGLTTCRCPDSSDESKANLIYDADDIQGGAHESHAYRRSLVLVILVEADLGSNGERDGFVKTITAIDQS